MRTYKKVDKKEFTCVCGCGRKRLGNAKAQYYEPYCRLVAFVKRRRNGPMQDPL